jgi:hypothetical protein
MKRMTRYVTIQSQNWSHINNLHGRSQIIDHNICTWRRCRSIKFNSPFKLCKVTGERGTEGQWVAVGALHCLVVGDEIWDSVGCEGGVWVSGKALFWTNCGDSKFIFFYCTYELTFQHSLLYFLLGFSPIFFLMKTDQQVFAGFFLSFCLG